MSTTVSAHYRELSLRLAFCGIMATMERNPYTFRQRADHKRLKEFARAYVANGGNASAAAEAAGFRPNTGSSLLRRAEMPGLIAAAMRGFMGDMTPALVQVLYRIALDDTAPTKDRVNAANSLLDRGPHSRKQSVEHEHTLIEPSKLIAEVWERRQARLAGPDAPQVIDAQAEPVDAS
jgi:hypothetical protein